MTTFQRTDDPLSPDYVPSVFCVVKSLNKQHLRTKMTTFQRRTELRQRKSTVVEVSNTASTSDCEMVYVNTTEGAISQVSDVNKGIQTDL